MIVANREVDGRPDMHAHSLHVFLHRRKSLRTDITINIGAKFDEFTSPGDGGQVPERLVTPFASIRARSRAEQQDHAVLKTSRVTAWQAIHGVRLLVLA